MSRMSMAQGLCLAALITLSGALATSDPTSWHSLRPSKLSPHRDSEIRYVPGFDGPLPSRQYGGYITVDKERGRHLFYYFVTSSRSPQSDPVVLWLNGGPGCSSFDGFVYEHGPFLFGFRGGKDEAGRIQQQLELRENPHSWSRVAHVLYVDSPAGVGMSYYETKADGHTNDTHTAQDLNTFLRLWFQEFSEFQDNEFYISGESFAGVYVPLATQAVLDGNDAGQEPKINLKGYLVGNGVTDPVFDGNALVPFAFGKSLIGAEQYHRAYRNCQGGSYWNATAGTACDHSMNGVWSQLSALNMYGILDSCYHGHNPYHGVKSGLEEQQSVGGARPSPEELQHAMQSHRRWPLLGGAREGRVPGLAELGLGHTPPCLDSREMWAFCNDDEVRKAIHARPKDEIGHFDECTNGERIHYTHNVPSMIPIHLDLLDRGMDALIYSGDHDMAVPHTGSEAWTSSLKLETRQKWRPWFLEDKQVAGYAVHYKGLIYATIKGAGHMVPEDKPRESLAMLERFLRERQL